MAREQREQRAPAAVARKAPTVRRVASGILAFLILFYIGYQIWAANYESLKFETATWATAADSFQTTGYAIRKETVITQDEKTAWWDTGCRMEVGFPKTA